MFCHHGNEHIVTKHQWFNVEFPIVWAKIQIPAAGKRKSRHEMRKSAKQKQINFDKLLAEHRHRFDMSCDFCSKTFDSLDDARLHYASEHNNPMGYIKCCKAKLKHRNQVVQHLDRHLNPNKLKYVQCACVLSVFSLVWLLFNEKSFFFTIFFQM